MIPLNKSEGPPCKEVRAMLSEYTDNTVSARSAWIVEKHLAGCKACAEEARQMQAMVQLLQSAPRLDTSDNFMASLHARLDTVDPNSISDRSVWDRLRSWLMPAGVPILGARVPAIGLGLAAAACALVLALNRPESPAVSPAPPAAVADSVHLSIASSANSPFSDPAADNLEFRSGARASQTPTPF